MATFVTDGARFALELVRDRHTVVEHRKSGARRTSLGSEREAIDAFDRRVVEIFDEGWHLATPDADLGLPVACDPDQERAILDAVDDRADLLDVYADWLMQRGDPCGELASLRARVARVRDPALAALISRFEAAHDRALFGLFHRTGAPRGVIALVWRDGWVDALDIATSSGTLLVLALLAPIARFVTGLVFQRTVSRQARTALARSPHRARIRSLSLAFEHDAQAILDLFPALDRIAMSVRNRAPRGHPLVRRLELTSFGAMGLVGTWPRVDTVAVHLQRHFTVPKPADLLSAALPALHTIELSGDAAACDAFAAEVPRSLHLVRT